MLGVGFKAAKKGFFDRRIVTSRVEKMRLRVLSRYGSYVRRTAIGLLRMSRQKRLGELGPKERQIFRIRQEVAKRKGFRPPRRPEASSRPGEPPRLHVRPASQNPLRKLLYFVYDTINASVVIGPVRFKSGDALEKLERGKGKHRARPFMGPANAKEASKLPAMWRDAL